MANISNSITKIWQKPKEIKKKRDKPAIKDGVKEKALDTL